MALNRVDLPAPFGPTTATRVPSGTVKVTPSRGQRPVEAVADREIDDSQVRRLAADPGVYVDRAQCASFRHGRATTRPARQHSITRAGDMVPHRAVRLTTPSQQRPYHLPRPCRNSGPPGEWSNLSGDGESAPGCFLCTSAATADAAQADLVVCATSECKRLVEPLSLRQRPRAHRTLFSTQATCLALDTLRPRR